MSTRSVSGTGLASKTLTSAGVTPWVRNRFWPELPSISASEEKFVGLHAVWPQGANFLALTATATGGYFVNYGDGSTTQTVASGQAANYLFDYNAPALVGTEAPVSISSNVITRNNHGLVDGQTTKLFNVTASGITEGQPYFVVNATPDTYQISESLGGPALVIGNGSASLLPYRVAIVTVTPTSTFSAFNLHAKHSQSLLQAYRTGWLDVAFAGSATTLSIGGSSVYQSLLERAAILRTQVTTYASLFQNCYSLKSVSLGTSGVLTGATSMFSGCSSLQEAPFFDTSTVSLMGSMFQNCYDLVSVPAYNTQAATTLASTFAGCYRLTSIPLLNTSNVTNMNNMFLNCNSLVDVPLLNTSKVTNFSFMFSGCAALRAIPAFDTSAATNMSSMFSGCYSLEHIPMLNTINVTIMNNMFQNCYALNSVPKLDTSKVTNTSYMFSQCYNLESIPQFNTPMVTNMSSMFEACANLSSVPVLNTSLVTNVQGMFTGCRSLISVPALNLSAVSSATNISNFIASCSNLTNMRATGIRFSFSVATCKLSGSELDAIYTNLPTVTGQAITVTSNYGTATDTPSIATAKGWTVTGS